MKSPTPTRTSERDFELDDHAHLYCTISLLQLYVLRVVLVAEAESEICCIHFFIFEYDTNTVSCKNTVPRASLKGQGTTHVEGGETHRDFAREQRGLSEMLANIWLEELEDKCLSCLWLLRHSGAEQPRASGQPDTELSSPPPFARFSTTQERNRDKQNKELQPSCCQQHQTLKRAAAHLV